MLWKFIVFENIKIFNIVERNLIPILFFLEYILLLVININRVVCLKSLTKFKYTENGKRFLGQ